MLPLANPRRPFFVQAITVRTVKTLTEWVKRGKEGRKKESKKGKEVFHGRLNFLAGWPTARTVAMLEGATNIVVFIPFAETAKGGNVHGFNTSWVS